MKKVEVDVKVIEQSLQLCDTVIKIAERVPKWIFNATKDPEFARLQEFKKDLDKILLEQDSEE